MLKYKTKAKSHRVQVTTSGGVRKSVRLPKGTPKTYADSFRHTVFRLSQAVRRGIPFDPKDQAWIIEQPPKIKKQLATLGIIHHENQQATVATIKAFSENFAERFSGTSRRKLLEVSERLVRFFGDVPLTKITNDDAQVFQRWLVKPKSEGGEGLAEKSTARRYIGYCVQIWKAGINQKLFLDNPFKQDELKKVVQTNRERHYRISPELSQKIYNVIMDPFDRLRFVLLRYQGLRAPSEINALKWSDVNFQNQKIRIRSSKTRHDKNGGVRVAPIFPEVLPELRAVFRLRGDCESVLPKLSHTHLTKHVLKWLGRADVERWPQLLVNFRRNAVTDAHDNSPGHIVGEWFGHCEKISEAFYTMRTPEHFAKIQMQKSSLKPHE